MQPLRGRVQPQGVLRVLIPPGAEEGRGLCELLGESVVSRDVRRHREVHAVRGVESAVEEVLVSPIRVAVVVDVGQQEKGLSVASLEAYQSLVEVCPCALVVEGDEHAGHRKRSGQFAVADLQGVLVQLRHVSRDLCPEVAAAAFGAARTRLAVGDERLEVLLEADDLAVEAVVRGNRRVDNSIERQRADAGGEEVGVPLPDVRAIREAEEGQLLVTHGDADLVHVLCGTGGIHEGQEVATALLAAGGEVLVGLDERLLFLRVVEHGIRGEVLILLRSVDAGDGRALGHATRIPRHQVEPVVEDVQRMARGLAAQEFDSRLTRTARVHQHRADSRALVGGGLADERERDHARGRVRVIERHLQRSALESAAAVGPCDLAGLDRRRRVRHGWRVARARHDKERDEHHDLCDATRHRSSLAARGPN